MGEETGTEWPDDSDPFGETSLTEDKVEQPLAVEEEPLIEAEPQISSDEPSILPVKESQPLQEPQWTLPVRAAPLLEQFHEELVTEFPLQQTADGTKCTSLVVDDDLLRIIETRLDLDGQRRMNVSLSMKRELTGFKHHHNELMHKHQYLWLGLSLLGVVLLVSNILVFTLLGLAFVGAGILNWTKMHLETHRLEFANSGGVLTHTLRGYGTDRPFFRASMAYLGSEMANLLRTGTLDTSAVDELHATLAAPPPPPAPVVVPIPQPMVANPSEASVQQPVGLPMAPSPMLATTPSPVPATPQMIPPSPQPIPGPPTATPLPIPAIPPPPQNIPAPPPLMAGPPVATPLPAAPIPPPAPLPPIAGGMPLPPPLGLAGGPIPLDAPMPNAPEVAVTASPVEDTLSEEEQNNLLNELS